MLWIKIYVSTGISTHYAPQNDIQLSIPYVQKPFMNLGSKETCLFSTESESYVIRVTQRLVMTISWIFNAQMGLV